MWSQSPKIPGCCSVISGTGDGINRLFPVSYKPDSYSIRLSGHLWIFFTKDLSVHPDALSRDPPYVSVSHSPVVLLPSDKKLLQ